MKSIEYIVYSEEERDREGTIHCAPTNWEILISITCFHEGRPACL